MADPEKEKLKEERKLDVEEKNLEDALIIKPLDGRHFSYRLGVPFCVIPDQFSCYRPLIFRKKTRTFINFSRSLAAESGVPEIYHFKTSPSLTGQR